MAGHEMSHRELIAELVEALEALLIARTYDTATYERARAILEKAKLVETCIPIEDAYEAAMDHGH
ncbi:hypothetical protein LCGC14_0981590 [marine sediment metagenome]|uniref:Uncharacterized protein n=1 Tax=marine sediment metagenome TaxID=412755 RepID=A0A0F9QRX6_9ZZZZ